MKRRSFKIGEASDPPILALRCASADFGETLTGTVTYAGEPARESRFQARYQSQNVYQVEIDPTDKSQPTTKDRWLLGARTHQKIVALTVRSGDDGQSLTGTITYAGERPLQIHAVRRFASATLLTNLLSDLLHAEWVEERTVAMEKRIVASARAFADALTTLNGSADKFVLDRDFQIEQLGNLQAFSHALHDFARYTLIELMNASLQTHRTHADDSLDSVAPLHWFRAGFAQIAADHEIIQQALHQRIDHEKGIDSLYAQAVELLILDKLAFKALAPFQHLLLDNPNTSGRLPIITYLCENTHIRLVPYTKQFLLIGISYDRFPPAATLFDGEDFIGKNFYGYELMAIPHEIAHYVYQHGKLAGKSFPELSEKFETNPYYRWCEEIFADVYGCIVAGPLAAISMQALLTSIDRDRAWKDDEQHPTPVLRLFMLAEILRELQQLHPERYAFASVADKLDQDWAKILKRWGYDPTVERSQDRPFRPIRLYSHDNSALHLDTIVNVSRVLKSIRPMIVEFATSLFSVIDFGTEDDGTLSTQVPWTLYDGVETSLYNVEMARLLNLDVARAKVAAQVLPDTPTDAPQAAQPNPDAALWDYLRQWSERGPHGSGVGAH